jgi:hypothetical protein
MQVVDAGSGFHDVGGTNVQLRDVILKDFPGAQVRLDQTELFRGSNISVSSTTWYKSFAGVWISNGPGGNQQANYLYANSIIFDNLNTALCCWGLVDDGGYAHAFNAGAFEYPGVGMARLAGIGNLDMGPMFWEPGLAYMAAYDSQLQDLSLIYHQSSKLIVPYVGQSYGVFLHNINTANEYPGAIIALGNPYQVAAISMNATACTYSAAPFFGNANRFGTLYDGGANQYFYGPSTLCDVPPVDGTGVDATYCRNVTLGLTGTTYLTSNQQLAGQLIVASAGGAALTGTVVINFGNLGGGFPAGGPPRTLDLSAVVAAGLGGHTVKLANGSGAVDITTLLSSKTVVTVFIGGNNTINAG